MLLSEGAGPVEAKPADAQGDAHAREPFGTRRLHPARAKQAPRRHAGSEVDIAVAAADRLLTEYGLAATVVSIPCWELFEEQDSAYHRQVPGTAPRIAVEAAARHGRDRWIGENGAFIGMSGFGASAPAPELDRHFGITAEAVSDTALKLIARGD
jgi:transketolase